MIETKRKIRPTGLVLAALVATMAVIFIYLMVRTSLFLVTDFRWYEKLLAGFMLLAEGFLLVHSFGYFLNVFHTLSPRGSGPVALDHPPPLNSYPPVAIIVSSFHEPLEVVEDTVTCFYNLTYPNKRIYFLDDTRYDRPGQDPAEMEAYRNSIDEMCSRIGVNLFRRKWHGAKAGMINDFLEFIDGERREGFQFRHLDGTPREEKEKYVIVFDADMNPFPDFVEPLVAFMEASPMLAFIQTPQYYSNFEANRVARAAGLQQAIFYEYICEGKSRQDAMFACGTNIILRREALMDVGGFDETSVTEDFATSLKFHLKGWSSAYYNRVCAFGMGPEDLAGYFKQQFRWALGTLGLLRRILGIFARRPFSMSPAKWWEYGLSGTHYLVGWVFLTMAACPVLFLFLGVPTYFARPEIYFMFFMPYLVLSVSIFAWTLDKRYYRMSDLFFGVLLQAISFPVYIKASVLALLGIRGTFGITPKGGGKMVPLIRLWPQVGLDLICFAAVIWGLHRIYYEREPLMALAVNTFWCVYHFLILSTAIYFNRPEEGPAEK